MIRRHIRVWIGCLVLLAFSLSAWFLFGGKQNEPVQNPETEEISSAPAESQNASDNTAENAEKEPQAEQIVPDQPIENNTQEETYDDTGSAEESELPEIEIPMADDSESIESESPVTEEIPEPDSSDDVSDPDEDIMLPEV